jgi:DNA-binding transcriptional LysR family regulator
MDTEFVRTFLSVAAAGNFVGAARRLHVTQSTVSTRILALESQLGAALFRRGRSGAELTTAGHRFLRHAQALVQTLAQARHDVGLPEGFRGSLTLSGRLALWDGFLPRWVARMRDIHPDISLRLEVGFEEGILQGLVQGLVDVGVMYAADSRPGLSVERLFEETLVMVASESARPWPDPGYIHMDWGPDFQNRFTAHFPEIPPPAITVNLGWVVIQQLQHGGGSGYLPLRIARELIRQGLLWRQESAPTFPLPVYMVFPAEQREDTLADALDSLRALAILESGAGKT